MHRTDDDRRVVPRAGDQRLFEGGFGACGDCRRRARGEFRIGGGAGIERSRCCSCYGCRGTGDRCG